MTHSLVLSNDGLVALRVFLLYLRLTTIVKEELRLVKVFLFASGQIEAAQRHLSNLVSRHHAGLTWVRSHLTTHHIGIATGNIEEFGAACSLPMGYGAFNHVSQVIELVREVFLLHPTLPSGSCAVAIMSITLST